MTSLTSPHPSPHSWLSKCACRVSGSEMPGGPPGIRGVQVSGSFWAFTLEQFEHQTEGGTLPPSIHLSRMLSPWETATCYDPLLHWEHWAIPPSPPVPIPPAAFPGLPVSCTPACPLSRIQTGISSPSQAALSYVASQVRVRRKPEILRRSPWSPHLEGEGLGEIHSFSAPCIYQASRLPARLS